LAQKCPYAYGIKSIIKESSTKAFVKIIKASYQSGKNTLALTPVVPVPVTVLQMVQHSHHTSRKSETISFWFQKDRHVTSRILDPEPVRTAVSKVEEPEP